MRYKLTPELSYIIALYGKRKSKKGIGVRGNDEVLGTFLREALKLNLTQNGKILYDKGEVYFYHSKLKKFFDKILNEREDRFIFINDYSSSYFAGVFDSVGKIENGKIVLGRYDIKDSISLNKLGFVNKKKSNNLVLEGRELEFIKFIQKNLKIKRDMVNNLVKNFEKSRKKAKKNFE